MAHENMAAVLASLYAEEGEAELDDSPPPTRDHLLESMVLAEIQGDDGLLLAIVQELRRLDTKEQAADAGVLWANRHALWRLH